MSTPNKPPKSPRIFRRNRSPSVTSHPEPSDKCETAQQGHSSQTDLSVTKMNPKKAQSAPRINADDTLDESPDQPEQHGRKRSEPIVFIATSRPEAATTTITTQPTTKFTPTSEDRTRIGNAPSPDPERIPVSPWKRHNLLTLSSSSEDDDDNSDGPVHAHPKPTTSIMNLKQHTFSNRHAAGVAAEDDRLMRDGREERDMSNGKGKESGSFRRVEKDVPMETHSHFDDTNTHHLQAFSAGQKQSKAMPKVAKQESESESDSDSDSDSEAGPDPSVLTKIIKQEHHSSDDDDEDPYTKALREHSQPSRIPTNSPSYINKTLKRLDPFKTPAPRNLNRKRKRVSFSSPLISPSPVHASAESAQVDQTSSPEPPLAKGWRRTLSRGSYKDDSIMISSDDSREQEEERDEEFEALPLPTLIAEKPREFLRRATLAPLVAKRGRLDSGDDGDDEESEVDTPTPAPRPARSLPRGLINGGSGISATKSSDKAEVSSPLKRKIADAGASQDDEQEEEDVAFDFYDESELASEHDAESGRDLTPSLPSSPPREGQPTNATEHFQQKRTKDATASISPSPPSPPPPIARGPSPGYPVQLAAAHIGQASILIQEATETMHLASERHFFLSSQQQLHQKELVGRFLGSFYPPLETKAIPPEADQNGETKVVVDKKMRRLYKELRKEAEKLLKVADDLQPAKVAKSPCPSKRAADTDTDAAQMTEEMTHEWKVLTAKITLVIINLRTTIDVWSKIMEIGWKRVAYVQHKKVPLVGAHGRVRKGIRKRAKQQYKIAKRQGKVKKQERKEAEKRLSRMNEVGMWGTGSVFSRERRESGKES